MSLVPLPLLASVARPTPDYHQSVRGQNNTRRGREGLECINNPLIWYRTHLFYKRFSFSIIWYRILDPGYWILNIYWMFSTNSSSYIEFNSACFWYWFTINISFDHSLNFMIVVSLLWARSMKTTKSKVTFQRYCVFVHQRMDDIVRSKYLQISGLVAKWELYQTMVILWDITRS